MKKIATLLLFPLFLSFCLLGTTIASNLYWVNNSGNWEDGAHWSITSGGAAAGIIPGAADNVYFDENSFNQSGQNITVNGIARCKTFSCAPAIPLAALKGSASAQLYVGGSFLFSRGIQNQFHGTIYFYSNTAQNVIESANQLFLGNLFFEGVNSSWALQNHLLLDKTKTITLSGGKILSNNYFIQAKTIHVFGPQKSTLDLGKSTVILQNKIINDAATNFTLKKKDAVLLNPAVQKFSGIQAIIDSIHVTVTPPKCNGDSNAIVEVDSVFTATPGVYTYALTDGNSNYSGNPMVNLPAGTYIITVTNTSNGEVLNQFVIINDPPPIIIPNYTKTQPKCFGDCNGKVRANPLGGTPSYSYLWNNGQTGQTDSLLCGGSVSVIVTDSKGCAKSFTTNLNQPTPLLTNLTKRNISCNGACDGTARVTPSGGAGTYAIQWTPGGSTNPQNNLCPGTYRVQVTDISGCIKRDSAIITEPLALLVNTVKTDISCNGACDGSITATPAGGRAPYTFSWSAPIVSTSATVNALCAGSYTVFVRDSSNCLSQQTVVITQPNALTATISPSQITCFGQCNGSAVASTSGGTPPYSFSWNTGVLSSSLTNLCIGTYTLFITDAKNCSTSVSVTITQPNQLIATSSKTDITCNGGCDGTANILPSGGTAPFTYLWLPGNQTSSNLTALCAGVYTYTVKDVNNCSVPGSVTITEPLPLAVAATPTQPSCNGVCDGKATASGSGGTGPYTYSWSNGLTTSTIVNLCPGVYTVEVTDSRGCKASNTVTITQPPLLTINLASTTSSCGVCTGTATVSPAGGTQPYQYSWSNSQLTPTAVGLCIGNYSVIVTDANNCQVNRNLTIDPVVVILITSSSTNALCANSCNGTATANASGGQQPYSFLWFPSGQTTQTATGLCAGIDSVRVTDANGCFNVSTITFTDPPVLNNSVNVTNATCFGSCNGSAISIPTGGTPPYTFSWSAAGQTGNSVNGLCAGTQTVTITDNNGCTKVSTFTVTEPTVIAANEVVVKSQCLLNNGSITLAPTGGTAPYTYSWAAPLVSNSSSVSNLAAGSYSVTITDALLCSKLFTIAISDAAGPIVSSSKINTSCPNNCDGSISTTPPVGVGPFTYLWTPGNSAATSISNLCAGAYSVKITDANGCNTLLNDTIISPPAISSNAVTVNTSCGGQCNGSLTLTPSGGTNPFTYSWSTGALGTSISNLCVGSYIVRISDANNCFDFDTLTISEPAALVLNLNKTNVTCNGNCDGKITGVVSGGTLPYSYVWSNGPTVPSVALLCPNSYTLTVTDFNNCNISSSETITEPAVLDGLASFTPNSCNAACDGTVDVQVNGGTPPFTYLWSPGNYTNPAVSDLCAGTYSVTINDFNNCSVIKTVNVTEPSLISVATTFTSPSCNAACDGTATATPSGGSAPYSYSWSVNGLTSQTITNLCAGTYTVFVTDLNGCSSSQTVTVTQPAVLVANASSVNSTCKAVCNGTATVIPSGGSGVYTYSWLPSGQTTQSISGVCAGTISVIVTDANGCSVTQNLTLIDPAAITIVSGATPANCGACDGALAIFPAGGSGGPYTYSWTPTNQTGQIAINLCAGLYSVTVTDVNNCVQPFTLPLSNNAGPDTAVVTLSNASCNGQCNGTMAVAVSGGTLPYTYSWLPTGPTGVATLTNQCAGVYILQTTDATGCIQLTSDTITEPLPIVSNDSVVDISCNGLSDGAIFLFPSGGTGAYSYSWNPPAGAVLSSITNLSAGPYHVTITDANNCASPFDFTVANPAAITIQQTHTDLSCNGVCNGSATVTPSGGTAPYRYSWSSSASDTLATVGNLCAGSYTVFVTDARNCSQSAIVVVNQPIAILSNLVKNDIKCFGQCNGSAKVSPSGGIGPYTFTWVGVVSSADSVSNLCAGNYAVNIADASGCFITVPVTITEPGLLNANINSVDISCNGSCDGTATSVTLGGTAPFRYLWSPGNANTAGITGLCAGTYVLTVIDTNNCSITQTAVISEPPVITSTFITTNPTCNTSNGSIIVNANGGTPGYTYNWIPGGSTNDTVSNLSANLYTVQITDSRGCSINSSVPLSTNAFTLSKLSLNASCFGRCDGLASVTPVGGTAPFTYLWTPGGLSTDSITNLCPGTYFPKVTDAIGCVVFETVQIIEPTAVQANVTSTDASCGLCDGTAQVSGTGGTGSYSYLWSINQTSFSVDSLCSGTYSVQVSDNSGCASTSNFNISNTTGPSGENIVKTDITCHGVCNGTVSITPIGGQAPYSYYWLHSGATTNSLNGLCAGTYTFEIIDANGCKRVSSVTITEPAAINPGTSFMNASCGICDGSITLNPTGGISPYTLLWSNGQSTSTLNALCAGVYSVQITDSTNCSTNASIILNNSNAPSISNSFTDATCFGTCDGSVFVSAFGGSSPYSYQWNTGQNVDTLYGLCAGTYFVTVNDVNNCKSIAPITIQEPTPLVFSLPHTTPASCGNCDGTASILPNGGTLPYTVFWSSGDTGAFANNLCAGVYSIFMKDKSECKTAATVTISNSTGPVVVESFTNESCANLCDGTASLTVTSGSPPYSYLWLQGSQTNASLTNLCAGTYDYQVTDSLGCIFTSSITLSTPGIISYNETQVQPSCGVCNGSITVNPSGGTGSYTYSWLPGGASTASISNLCAGIYTLHLTDGAGCSYIKVFTLNNSNGPGVTTSFTDAHCNAACDGTATAVVSGANAPFSYSWSPGGQVSASITGLCAGPYIIEVTDDVGCKTFNSISISEPPPILFSISNTVNASCGECNGSATIIPSGGVLPNAVLWSNSDLGLSADSLCAGIYTVSVTDNGGCVQTKNVSISNSSGPLVTATKTDETCSGSCNGTAQLTVTAGAGPFSFYWLFNGATTSSLSGLCAGSYNYEVIDTNGCVSAGSVTISPASTVNIAFTKTSPNCGVCDGALSTTITGGVGPYTYAWLPANTPTSSISNLCAGIYIATVTDINGCAQIDTVTLGNTTGPSIVYTATDVTCNTSCNGSITATASGINPGYTYSWTPGNQVSSTISNLCAGNYIVEAQDNLGCKGFQQISINEPSAISLSLSQIKDVLCFGDSSGSITVIPSGGTIPYQYLWSIGGFTTPTIAHVPNGNLFVTITDANGCDTVSPTLVISTPNALSASAVVTYAQCSNSLDGAIDLTPSGGTPPYSFLWDDANSTVTEDLTGVIAGVYHATINDANGCSFVYSDTIKALVIVQAGAGPDDTLCFTNQITLQGNGGSKYKWFSITNSGLQFIDSTFAVIVKPVVGINDFILVAYSGACSDTDTVRIFVNPLPETDLGPNVSIIQGSTVQLNAAGGTTGSSYLWSPTTNLVDTLTATPTATPIVTTTYTVKITNPTGCFAVDSITITVLPTIGVSNGITPNGDGKNDVWEIDGIQAYKNCEVEVYNRWGEKLFSSPGYVEKWDGKFKGKDLPVGTYYYIINLHDEVNTENLTGPITIMR
ncbi:MAG: gliding motility-associated C-terminal domain-containing protein [Bacteroidetes bacterium]|nr:gliding motility-associated C-terminal domain-containing protein [Bacteroidota bacterium]